MAFLSGFGNYIVITFKNEEFDGEEQYFSSFFFTFGTMSNLKEHRLLQME